MVESICICFPSCRPSWVLQTVHCGYQKICPPMRSADWYCLHPYLSQLAAAELSLLLESRSLALAFGHLSLRANSIEVISCLVLIVTRRCYYKYRLLLTLLSARFVVLRRMQVDRSSLARLLRSLSPLPLRNLTPACSSCISAGRIQFTVYRIATQNLQPLSPIAVAQDSIILMNVVLIKSKRSC